MHTEMTIGQLAERAGVAASTIRYYEEVKLLPRPARASGRRVFEEATLDRLMVITFAKEAGFSLREIRQLFDGFASDTAAGARWQKLATAKLAEMEALERRIKTMKELLREALRCGCVELDACGKLFRGRNA
jgi:MerR family transcriptional regulator, redox-sensitive transcriptional activator SoxR